MRIANDKYKLSGNVAMDEAYFTGRENNVDKPLKRGRGTNKSKVIVAISLTDEGKPKYARMQIVENLKQKLLWNLQKNILKKVLK